MCVCVCVSTCLCVCVSFFSYFSFNYYFFYFCFFSYLSSTSVFFRLFGPFHTYVGSRSLSLNLSWDARPQDRPIVGKSSLAMVVRRFAKVI